MPLSLTEFFTLLTTSLFLVLLLRSLLQKNDILLRTGTRVYLVLFVLMAARLFIPFEFGFEKTIQVTHILPSIRTFYMDTTFLLFGRKVYLKDTLTFCWVLGAAVAAFRSIRQYRLLKKRLLACSDECDQAITAIPPRLNRRIARRPLSFTVLQCPELTTPFVFGFFRPVIILPKIAMPKGDWRLILLHEMEHVYHGDLWMKLFFEAVCIIYWWNPLAYILRVQVGRLLELINDRRVADHLSQRQTYRYLACILKIAKAEVTQPKNVPQCVAALAKQEQSCLSQRIHLSVDAMCTRVSPHLRTLSVTGLCVLFFLSNAFILESAVYECPDPDAVSLTSENGYIIRNGELFDIYMDDEFFFTAEHPKEAYVELPIYNSKSEVPK